MSQEHMFMTLRGSATGSNGAANVPMSDADWAKCANSYDARVDPAPLVIGEPRLTDPAYGWVKCLTAQDGGLVATVHYLEPTFAEKVRNGDYSAVKASFYRPNSPNNTKPGSWYLKHIRFDGLSHTPPFGSGSELASFGQFDEGDLISFACAYDYKVSNFAMPQGYSADPGQMKLWHQARFVQACNPGMGWIDAVRKAQG